MKNKRRNMMIILFCFTVIFSNTILAVELKDGEVMFTKTSTWEDMENGIAKVMLKVDSKPVSRPSDVVLVVDRSGSMDFSSSIFLDKNLSGENGKYSICMNDEHWINGKHYYNDTNVENDKQDRYDKDKGCKNRYDIATIAVNNFLDNFYSNDENSNSRVALVTFNSNTDDIKSIFGHSTTSNQDFTNDKSTIITTMNNIAGKLSGGTNYTEALERAQEFIKSRNKSENKDGREDVNSRQTYIVFLTDGVPEPISDDGIFVANSLKQSGVIVYTVGIGENIDTGIISKISTSEDKTDGYFTTTTTATDLIDVYSKIANNMKNAGTNFVLTDVISDDFDYYEDEKHLPTATPSIYPKDSEDGKTIKWSKKEITDNSKTYEFYVKLKDNEKKDSGTWNTNTLATVTYTDINSDEKSLVADIPKLSRNKYIVEHYLENEDGSYTKNEDETEKYITNIGDKVVGIPKDFDGYVFNKDIEGSIIESVIEENKETVLKLYYSKKKSKVVVRYVDEDGIDLIDKIEMEGIIGSKYSTDVKEILGYTVRKILPENKDGVYLENEQEVLYVYDRVISRVIVEYIDLMGNKLAEDDIYEGYINGDYITTRKEIPGYSKYGKDPKNTSGKYIDGDILVTYVYDISSTNNVEDVTTDLVDTSDINITSYVILMLLSFVVIGYLIYKIRKLNSKKDN